MQIQTVTVCYSTYVASLMSPLGLGHDMHWSPCSSILADVCHKPEEQNKMRNKILVDHHDHHVRMAVADWEQTMINIDQPQFCFSSEHGWQNTIAIRAIHKVCGWPWPGLRTYRSRSRRTQRCGVPWSSAGKPWPLLLDVGWGSHFLEAMQCNTIYRII